MITSRTNAICSVMLISIMLISIACQQQAANNSANANAAAKATPANTSVALKPTEAETKRADPAPVGKETKVAEVPKLKSIEPAEGMILGGVLNDIATSLPQPFAGAAAESVPPVPDIFCVERVRHLVATGKLESEGNLDYMGFSEVRLPGQHPDARFNSDLFLVVEMN